MRVHALLAAGVATCVLTGGATAEQVSIVSSKDNTLFEDPNGELSNGSGQHMFVGLSGPFVVILRRAVMAFDIASAVPAGATITNVELRLNVSASLLDNQSLELHRLVTDWGEAGSNALGEEGPGDGAHPGDATWLHTFFADSFWTNPGGDFDATISASTIVGAASGYYTWSSAQMVAEAQSWLDNPDSNFGWILMGGEDVEQSAKRFDTREHSDPSKRPTLIITYVPAPGALALLAIGAFAPRRRRR